MTDFGSSPHSHDSSDDIIEAEIVSNPTDPQSPAQSRRVVWFVMGLASLFFFLLLMVAGVAVWLMVRGGEGDRQAVVVAPPGVRIGTKWDHVKEAYANPHCDVDPETRGRIEQSIQRIFKIAGNGDLDATLRHVDCDAFMERLAETGTCDPNWADRIVIRSSFADVTSGPQAFAQFRTSSIDVIDDDKIIVYMYAWDAEDEIFEVRWWMTRSGNQWKVYDWESLLYGVSEADEYAVLLERQETTGVQNVYKAHEYYLEGAAALEAGEQEEGVKKIERAQALRVDPDLRNKMTLQNAFWLSSYGETEKAKKLFASIGKPEDCPGAWYGLAICAGEEGDYQQVIHYADLYINRVGASPDAVDLKVDALLSTGQRDLAATLLKDNLKLFPDRSRVLQRIYYLTPVERRADLLPLFNQLDDPVAEALRIAGQATEPADWPFLELLEEYVRDNGASQAQIFELDAVLNTSRYRLSDAFKSWSLACMASKDEVDRERLQQRCLITAARMDQPLRGYRGARDKEEAFEFFQQAYNLGDYELSHEAMLELTEARRLDFSEEPLLDYLAGSICSDQGDYEAAVSCFQTGLRLAGKNGDDDSIELYQSRLNTERVYTMSPVEALKSSTNRATTFEVAAGRLAQDWIRQNGSPNNAMAKKTTALLKQLVDMHADDPEPSTRLQYFRAILAWQSGERGEAIDLLATLIFTPGEAPRFYSESQQLARWLYAQEDWPSFLSERVSRYRNEVGTTNVRTSDRNVNETGMANAVAIKDLFNELSELLIREGRFDEVGKLAEIHQKGSLPEPDRKMWLLQTFFLEGKDAALIELANSISESQWGELDYTQSTNAKKYVFESLMRSGDYDQAITWAEKEVGSLSRDLPLLAVAQTARQDLSALDQTLEEMVDRYWEYNRFAGHPLARDFLREKAFGDLRTRFPPESCNPGRETNVFYCFGNQPAVGEVQALLHERWSDKLIFEPVLSELRPSQKAFVASGDDRVVILNFVSHPLEQYGAIRSELVALPFVVSVSYSGPDDPRFSFDRLEGGMRRAGCKACYRNNESELVWLGDSENPFDESTPPTRVEQSVYLNLSESGNRTANWLRMRRACELISRIKSSKEGKPSPDFEVLVEFSRGTAVESLWLPVDMRSESSPLLIATRIQPVKFFPDLQVGESQAIRLEQIAQWRESKKK